MLTVFRTALAGVQRNLAGLNTTAQNIAQVNTDGYRAQRYDSATGTTRAKHDAPPVQSPASGVPGSDVDLAGEFVDLKSYELGTRASATVITFSDRTLGTLLDILE